MYRVEQLDPQKWAIIDPRNATLYIGTQRQCEDWLDHRQNIERHSTAPSLWKRFWNGLTGMGSGRPMDLNRVRSRNRNTAYDRSVAVAQPVVPPAETAVATRSDSKNVEPSPAA